LFTHSAVAISAQTEDDVSDNERTEWSSRWRDRQTSNFWANNFVTARHTAAIVLMTEPCGRRWESSLKHRPPVSAQRIAGSKPVWGIGVCTIPRHYSI